MAWLIALACLAMLVGSVSMLRPSPRERRQARLREEAFALGLRVRMRQLNIPGAPETRQVATYILPRDEGQVRAYQSNPTGCIIVRAAGGGLDAIDERWQFLESDRGARVLSKEFAQLVAELNMEILGLLSTPGAVGVFWDEKAKEVSVIDLKALLERLLSLTSR